MVSNVSQVIAFEPDYRPGDVWMGFLPFYHIYALTWILHTSIAKVGSLMPSLRADHSRNVLGILKQGICVVVMQRFDLQQYLEAVQNVLLQELLGILSL